MSLPAAQRAYVAVKDRILSGEIRAGDLLSEVETAQSLAVSRTPVHEAFLRLEAEDLLRLIPRRGAVVVPVPLQEARDVLEVRLALETAAVRRLAQSPIGLAPRLAAILAEQREWARRGDVPGFAAADEAFHRAIVTASGNMVADRLYASLADRQRRMTIGAVRARPDRLPVLVEEHERLAALVAAGNALSFEAALGAHLENTHDVLGVRA